MPRFEPFPAIRYADGAPLADVTAPPYDVLSDADRSALAARHPNNVVVIDVPVEADGPGRYDAAAAMLRTWLASGVLVQDGPAFYRSSMTFTDETGVVHRTVGLLGGLEVVPEGGDGVLPHEQTTPKAKTDRLDLTRATGMNLSAVWGLSMADGLAEAVAAAPATELGAFTDDAGVRHDLARIDDPAAVAHLQAVVEAAPVVIADGHHRYAISRTYAAEQRAAHDGAPGAWDLTLTFVVQLAPEHLFIQAIHRLLTDLEGTSTELALRLDAFFERRPAGPVDATITARMAEAGALCLVHPDGTGEFLVPRPERFAGRRDLDSLRLEAALDGVAHTKTYQHGVEHVLAALRAGRAQAAVLLRPVSIAEIQRTADERVLMPPKSTFFAPKPRTGLVIRPASD